MLLRITVSTPKKTPRSDTAETCHFFGTRAASIIAGFGELGAIAITSDKPTFPVLMRHRIY